MPALVLEWVQRVREDWVVTLEIRPATGNDWQTVRDTRFAALQDTPSPFGSDLASERRYTEDDWRRWVNHSRMGDHQVIYLAFEGDRCVGIVGAFEHEPNRVRLISM